MNFKTEFISEGHVDQRTLKVTSKPFPESATLLSPWKIRNNAWEYPSSFRSKWCSATKRENLCQKLPSSSLSGRLGYANLCSWRNKNCDLGLLPSFLTFPHPLEIKIWNWRRNGRIYFASFSVIYHRLLSE